MATGVIACLRCGEPNDSNFFQTPSHGECNFNRFWKRKILTPKKTYRNGQGLHGVCAGVRESTLDPYDSQAYRARQDETTSHKQPSVLLGKLATKVTSIFTPTQHRKHTLRGHVWTDYAEAVTVSFRMSRDSFDWESDDDQSQEHISPTIGFRSCRVGPFESETPQRELRAAQPPCNLTACTSTHPPPRVPPSGEVPIACLNSST